MVDDCAILYIYNASSILVVEDKACPTTESEPPSQHTCNSTRATSRGTTSSSHPMLQPPLSEFLLSLIVPRRVSPRDNDIATQFAKVYETPGVSIAEGILVDDESAAPGRSDAVGQQIQLACSEQADHERDAFPSGVHLQGRAVIGSFCCPTRMESSALWTIPSPIFRLRPWTC
ncbi:hypothetical protein K437DRAFT_62884 [Tilletiaria anomala UBC 951]|uniref:Uncharacterized protein n=1 Tax=Tilletiaria anomala (strain ATCC 24038 / CBS 436.72 / UBC 951) TaxID=1037660 RepID=A0A066VC11_TILAU|nr:uncharacterized protein K437DRAFT_62884 [Tilletiaria anomala UBC 951]KDN36135.1 hypothetical protein K437DRAFT_62884 [Tilletiaria anomala UBC 951]